VRLDVLGIAGEAYKSGRCACGEVLRVQRRAGLTECPCGALYQNLTGQLAIRTLLAEMGHTGVAN
jgi:hypothetical protein